MDKIFFFIYSFCGVNFVVDVTVCAHNSLNENLLCCIMLCVRKNVYLRGHERLSLHLKVYKKIFKSKFITFF
jgi:hypothetical protein